MGAAFFVLGPKRCCAATRCALEHLRTLFTFPNRTAGDNLGQAGNRECRYFIQKNWGQGARR